MAIYHLSAKPISRSAGRSATAAAAYRAGVEITDERTGEVHDYSRKRGVLHSEIILPGGGTADRAVFWNRVEHHHKRGDAVIAREIENSLPSELTPEQRQSLAVGFAHEMADRHGVAADVSLHAPRTVTDRDLEKDPDQYWEIDPETGRRHNGNWHAHIMLSACHVQPDGTLGKKAVELDPIHCQRAKIENLADRERARWGKLANAALERHGHQARIDHRTLEAQGIDRAPTVHLGPAASGYERRTGEPSAKRIQQEQEAAERLARAKSLGDQERQIDQTIIDLSCDLRAAQAEKAAIDLQAGAPARAAQRAIQRAQVAQQRATEEAAQRRAEAYAADLRAQRVAVDKAAADREQQKLRADALAAQQIALAAREAAALVQREASARALLERTAEFTHERARSWRHDDTPCPERALSLCISRYGVTENDVALMFDDLSKRPNAYDEVMKLVGDASARYEAMHRNPDVCERENARLEKYLKESGVEYDADRLQRETAAAEVRRKHAEQQLLNERKTERSQSRSGPSM